MLKPILFNTEMVKAIQDGRKTQTRRIVKELGDTPLHHFSDGAAKRFISHGKAANVKAAPCEPGDILWVRETWRPARGIMHTYLNGEVVESGDWHEGFEYKAGGYHFPDGFKESEDEFHLSELRSEGNWHPSIHMPKETARIFLRVKDVRAERLQDIAEEQAEKEGCSAGRFPAYGPSDGFFEAPEEWDAIEDFQRVWNETIKPNDYDVHGWDANPWVWVIEFERCEKPEGWC